MRLVLISDVYLPLRSSGAVQLRDLSIEFAKQGHAITVMVASPELRTPWILENIEGVQVLRLRAPATRDMGYIRRAIGELLMPFAMLWNLRKSPLRDVCWGGVIWYSPTIFLGPLAAFLKWRSRCKSYLIIRDIFPEWALDMGLLRQGPVYTFFKAVAFYQYSVAEVIGVQSPGNEAYFANWCKKKSDRRIEVLHNWLADRPAKECSIKISQTVLQGRKIFVYAGNMGVAQGVDALLMLAASMREKPEIGFLFVGRGTEFKRMQSAIQDQCLNNTLLLDEIDPDEIPALYSQCHIGIVVLDSRHKTHNIPGKFLSYMLAGLPVLAKVNSGNDLVKLIENEGVGRVCTSASPEALRLCAEDLLTVLDHTQLYSSCKELAARLFSPKSAVEQIVAAIHS